MTAKRKVEVFSAGCPDTNDIKVAKRARDLGVRSTPAVAINGQLASCCAGAGIEEQALRAAFVHR